MMLAYQRLHTGRKDIIFSAYVFQPHHLVLHFAFQPFTGWPAAAPRALKSPTYFEKHQASSRFTVATNSYFIATILYG